MADKGILLESGTNELEIAEFTVDGQSFGINVAKVRELVEYDRGRVNHLVGAPHAVLGTYNYRGKPVPLISFHQFLGSDFAQLAKFPIVIISEFNQSIYAFLVDQVVNIHRISWSAFSASHRFIRQYTACVGGTFSIDDREILMLDYESITNQIFGFAALDGDLEETRQTAQTASKTTTDRLKLLRVIVVEDSRTIQMLLRDSLTAAGIGHIDICENGQVGLDTLEKLRDDARVAGKSLTDIVGLVISDIEMPAMDGLSLCRRIKSDPTLSSLPVVMFSSMINDEMAHKCLAVGASCCIGKPQIGQLVGKVRELCGAA